MKPIIAAFIAAFIFVFPASAAEQPDALYMPNSVGGFVILLNEPCRIGEAKHEYPYKAIATNDKEEEREGCWVRPDAPEPFVPFVNVFMIEEGSRNIGTFRQHLFSPEKKRWDDKHCDGCGTL